MAVISWVEAESLIEKFVTERTPVFACFTSADDATRIALEGSVDKLTEEGLFVIANDNPNRPSMMQLPVDKTCQFAYGDKRELPLEHRERLAVTYGDSVLHIVFSSGSRVTIFSNL